MNDLQLTINEINGEKNRCHDRIEILEKYEKFSSRNNSSTERELRRELEQVKGEKLTMIAEIEELKQLLHKVEITKREFEAQFGRLERERNALKRHVETVNLLHVAGIQVYSTNLRLNWINNELKLPFDKPLWKGTPWINL